jgi:hypothetical protein
MNGDQPLPDVCGVWRFQEAAVHFQANGRYETLHAICRGPYRVIRDTELPDDSFQSKTGFVIEMGYDEPGLLHDAHCFYLIHDYCASEMKLAQIMGNTGAKLFTVCRDT